MNSSTGSLLLFNWDAPRQRDRAIIGFLGASFAAHVTCFYLFQVVYPPTVSLMPAPQRVNFISAKSQEGETLLRWVEAEDPALASTTRRPPEAKRYLLGKIQHIPSYSENEPSLKEVPPVSVDLRVPSAEPPGPVLFTHPSKPNPIGTVSTKVTFSNEFDPIGQPQFVSTEFKASTSEPPRNAEFRIAVDRQGTVVYCFIVTSSGDAALDELAWRHLALCRFLGRPAPSAVGGSTPSGQLLVWGTATIEWGNDVAPSNPKPTPTAP